ncbi:MAG: IS30 family transposase, partial [Streptococcus lutetiensis]|nr:IS30 family transposase [Streptococcus lutetiensis]MDU7909924.1 IS30 family transposase [Streptococcus lutetiensis]
KNATQQQVAFIENWINNYPKKLFNYKSPKEFLQAGSFELEIWLLLFSTIE